MADLAPGLTDRYGVGPVTAAQAVVSFSHPGRCRTEAAFAALAGTNPIPASSGRIVRYRLNRGGDRALNCAIHTIALTRIRSCPRTRAYIQRRTVEGKTPREIRRCLKRYITRELYRQLTRSMQPANRALTNIEASEDLERACRAGHRTSRSRAVASLDAASGSTKAQVNAPVAGPRVFGGLAICVNNG